MIRTARHSSAPPDGARPSGPVLRCRIGVLLALLALLGAAPVTADAQQTTSPEGASDLLLPAGARTVAKGQAGSALEAGSESLWWNPAGLSRLLRPEAAVHHVQTLVFTGDLVAFAFPRQPFGVFTVGANLVNYGEQPITDSQTGEVIGTFQMRSTVAALAYSTTLGRHVNAGITYKVLRFHFESSVATTSAVDLGLQARRAVAGGELSVGAALRNVGLRLQFKDEQQADPLPTRLDLGASYARSLETVAPGLATSATLGVETGPRTAQLGVRAGGEVSWQGKYFARAGYASNTNVASGPSLGLGAESGRFGLDIARVFDEINTQNGTPPTFFSLRVRF